MELLYDIYGTKIGPECAATIGVFDGVHAGHRQVIGQMMHEARQHGYKSMVITFDKLPQQLFVPDFQAQLITTTRRYNCLRDLELITWWCCPLICR